MAAAVSSMVSTGNSEILITRDLLGEFSKDGNQDLDLQAFDVKSGGVYPQRCNSPNSPLSSSFNKKQRTSQYPELPDLIFPPLEEGYLELKLFPSSHCQSVCTLEKVKSALQRAEQQTTKKRRTSPSSPPSSLTSNSKEEDDGNSSIIGEKQSMPSAGMFAAACPGCLLYVITLKTNPKCPRCNSMVPSPLGVKKPGIDLNA